MTRHHSLFRAFWKHSQADIGLNLKSFSSLSAAGKRSWKKTSSTPCGRSSLKRSTFPMEKPWHQPVSPPTKSIKKTPHFCSARLFVASDHTAKVQCLQVVLDHFGDEVSSTPYGSKHRNWPIIWACSLNIMRPWMQQDALLRCHMFNIENGGPHHPQCLSRIPLTGIHSSCISIRGLRNHKCQSLLGGIWNKKTSKSSNCHHPLYGCFPSQTPPIFQVPPFECLPDSLEEKASRGSGGKQGLQLWMQPSVGFLNVFETVWGRHASISFGHAQRTRGCPSHRHTRTYLVWAKSNHVSSMHCGKKQHCS